MNTNFFTMTPKQRIAELLLVECKAGVRGWYYISCADATFQFGCVVEAFGPTDAWRRIHSLGWWERGETMTTGPIEPAVMERIPADMRWRKLNREEVTHLGE